MTGKKVKQYIEEKFGREPMHDVDAISYAANEVAYLYSSSTTAEQVVEFMLADNQYQR